MRPLILWHVFGFFCALMGGLGVGKFFTSGHSTRSMSALSARPQRYAKRGKCNEDRFQGEREREREREREDKKVDKARRAQYKRRIRDAGFLALALSAKLFSKTL